MGYGLFEGLNEAYDQFRGRESEIERESDREAAREALVTEREREEERFTQEQTLFAQQQEAHKYGIKRRAFEEEVGDANLKGQKSQNELLNTQVKMTADQYAEWGTPEAVAQRLETSALNLKALKESGELTKLNINDAKMTMKAKKGAEKYRKWKTEFMSNGDIDALVKNFNTDEDDANNIEDVSGNEDDGWKVTFENGQTATFADRNAVGIHLESMADPSFHQTYLLQNEAAKDALAKAIKKAAEKSPDTLSKDKKIWEDQTTKITDRLKGTIIKAGIVDFGEEGNKEIALLLGSIIDQVGAASQYSLLGKEVAVRANNIFNASTDLKPEAVRKRAIERYESTPADRFPDGKLDEDDAGYEDHIKSLMYADITSQIAQFERDVKGHYFTQNPETGEASLKKQNYGVAEKQEGTIPVPVAGETPIAGETKVSDSVAPTPKTPTPDSSVGTPAYKKRLDEIKGKKAEWKSRKSKLESKLGINRKDGKTYRKKIGAYIKGSEFAGLSVEKQIEIIDQFEDALTKVQVRRARKEIAKREGKRLPTSTPYPYGLKKPDKSEKQKLEMASSGAAAS